jgi:hypothetical protein
MPDYDPQGRGVAKSRGHEGADLSARKIAVATILLILLLVVTHVSLNAVIRGFATEHADHSGTNGLNPLAVGSQIPPVPRLQADPEKEMSQLAASQSDLLNSYGASPASRTTAHIPIEQAKVLLLQKGLPSAGAQPEKSSAPISGEDVDVR